MFMGHPAIATPVTLAGFGLLYVCWLGGSGGVIPAIFTLIAMGNTANASRQASAYRQWKLEWDALADPATAQPKWKPGTLAGFALGAFLILGWLILASQDHATNIAVFGVALDLGIVAAAFLGMRWLIRRVRRRPIKGAEPVAIVAKATSVPSLPQAYRALPEHCLRLLAPAAQ